MSTQDILSAVREGKRTLQQELRQAQQKVQHLQREIDHLDAMLAINNGRTRNGSGNGHTDPRKAAGPAVIAAVEKALREIKAAPQSLITATVGKHSGSVSWALKALMEDGVARPTGERINGSKVYEYVPPAKRVKIAPGK